jgi:hypothetical protein
LDRGSDFAKTDSWSQFTLWMHSVYRRLIELFELPKMVSDARLGHPLIGLVGALALMRQVECCKISRTCRSTVG